MLSVYLPMIPLIHWFGAITSWLGRVIEGVINASLWAFAHLDTDGEGMGRKAEYGYTFMLSLLLTPLLMVLGLIMSIVLMQVVGSLFASIFPIAIADIQAQSTTGVLSIIGFLVIFATTAVTLISTCCEMIHTVPDTALQWIGAHSTPGMGKQMAGQFAGGTGAVAVMADRSGLGGSGGEMGRVNQRKERELSQENARGMNKQYGGDKPSHSR